jgi:hypothetical protein
MDWGVIPTASRALDLCEKPSICASWCASERRWLQSVAALTKTLRVFSARASIVESLITWNKVSLPTSLLSHTDFPSTNLFSPPRAAAVHLQEAITVAIDE